MKTYAASIEFSSKTLSLKEICTVLGKSETPDSYSIGDVKFERQGPRKYSDLRYFSDAPKDATLLEHFLDAQKKLGSYDKLKVQGQDIRCEVSIAVFYETPFSTFDIPPEVSNWAVNNGFTIEISSYGNLHEQESENGQN